MKILVIDIGGTFVKYAIMDENAKIFTKGKVKTPNKGREGLIECIKEIADENKEIEGIAISICGIIDTENRHIVMGGGQMPYNDGFDFGKALYQRIPLPLYMENDAKCAAMAEASLGALKDVEDGFVLIFGTMIGGGYIHGHEVIHGKHFSAGEISYIFNGKGDYPDLEHVFGHENGVPMLCKRFAKKKDRKIEDVSGEVFFEALDQGDEDAAEILKDFTKKIAIQIFNIQTTLDVECFAIGGGISAQPSFIEAIRENLTELYDNCVVNIPRAQVVPCVFGNDANLYGALSCYLKHYFPIQK